MKIALWIIQVLLALMFAFAGFTKMTTPISKLAPQMPWVNDFSESMVRFVGAVELLGAIGLVLPALLRIKPLLTPLAALGLAVTMLFAAIYHLTKAEYQGIGINAVLGGLALFVAWGRYKKEPIWAK
ncbi:DoxX family protein [Runella salmonicolor]|uniref:DoxX family protein n=1 Tax=Runella salmonicolor TaxID=2950278 RepID=A0ABT1FSM1_9BACT|nr:DoxX family protein [Runella salmonicolor]MCP1384756.1 DoxX family protein [Runella salmonicolor]